MTDIKIDYETLAQDALRGVVRTVLAQVSQGEQLPGNHHFYISFGTTREGVGISKRLRDQYPEEMTIVMQHRYWDLQVHDDRFEVSLTFNSIPERLVVPFSALKVFFDPSVPYGLQFENTGTGGPNGLPNQPAEPLELPQRRAAPKRPKPFAVEKDTATPAMTERPAAAMPKLGLPKPKASSPSGQVPVLPKKPAGNGTAREDLNAPELPVPGQVVQLDTFRKK